MYKFTLSKIVVACALLVLVAGAAESEMRLSPKPVREEVRAVVQGQLAALRAGDFATAYGYAAAGIKERFDDEVFAAMIRRGYPALLQAREAELGMVHDHAGEYAEVTVSVRDRQKHTVTYRYRLVHEEEGWRIAGVTLEPRPSRGDI